MWERGLSRRYKNACFNSVRFISENCDLGYLIDFDSGIPTTYILDTVKGHLRDDFEKIWIDEIKNMPKLWTSVLSRMGKSS